MASNGGTWIKAVSGPMVGKMVFVPAQKAGKGSALTPHGKVDITGTAQGGLIVHKSIAGGTASGNTWTITHIGSGMSVPGGPYASKEGALAAMEEISQQYKWSNSIQQIKNDWVGGQKSLYGVVDKYNHAKPAKAKETVTTAKELQAIQKGKKTAAEIKATKTAAAEAKAAKSAEKKEAKEMKELGVKQDKDGNYVLPDGSKFGPQHKSDALSVAKQLKGYKEEKAATAAKDAESEAKAAAFIGATATKVQSPAGGITAETTTIANGVTITKLPNGKYYVEHSESGFSKSTTSAKDALDTAVDLAAGKPVSKVATATKTAATPKAESTTKTATTASIAATKSKTISQEEFDDQKTDIPVTYYAGGKGTAKGVGVENGQYAITKNENNGKYHLVDTSTGKTIGKYDSPSEAHAAAKANKATNEPAPSNPAYKDVTEIYGSISKGDVVFGNHFASHVANLTGTETSALGHYQDGGYGDINGALWGAKGAPITAPGIKSTVARIDSAMAKSPGLPHETVLYRHNGMDSSFGQMCKSLSVGDTYHSHAYDSTSINSSSWSGNATIIYRAPTGTKGFFMNSKGYNSKHPSEHEYLLPRNMEWKVVGKHQTGSSVTITVEYLGGNP